MHLRQDATIDGLLYDSALICCHLNAAMAPTSKISIRHAMHTFDVGSRFRADSHQFTGYLNDLADEKALDHCQGLVADFSSPTSE